MGEETYLCGVKSFVEFDCPNANFVELSQLLLQRDNLDMRFIALQLLALCCVSCHANEPVHRRKAAAENAAAAHSAHSPPRYQWVDYGTAEPEGFHSTRRSATQRPAEFQVESNYKQIRIKVPSICKSSSRRLATLS